MKKQKLILAIFINTSKKCFWSKKISILCTGSKVAFWKNLKIAKMALMNPCMKFEISFDQKLSFEALHR